MKILICTNNYRQGGVARTLQFYLAKMEEAGFDIDVFCLDPHGPYLGKYQGCKVLPKDKWISLLLCYRNESSWFSLVMKACRAFCNIQAGYSSLFLVKKSQESARPI